MRPPESFIGQPIRSLQTMLRVIEINKEDNTPLIPDGIYGPETMAAVSRFQRNHALPATGVTNQETWDTVVDQYDTAIIEQADAQPVQVTLNPGQVIHKGESNCCMYLAQSMLLTLSEMYHCISTPSITGQLDEATADALAGFQEMCSLPSSGNLDKRTWKHLALQYGMADGRANKMYSSF